MIQLLLRTSGLTLLVLLAAAMPAWSQDAHPPVCSEGIIQRISIDNQSIYPTTQDQPRLLRWVFRTANLLHIETTKSFIRRELVFEEGDCFDPFLLSESQRLLDQYPFLGEARVTATDSIGVGKIVHVVTRDEWSTQIDLGFSYDDGLNIERFQATEENFLGNGISAEVTHRERREVRDQNVRLFTPRFFGRTDAEARVGRSRGGSSFFQQINAGFVGETNRFSGSETIDRDTRFFSFTTGGAEAVSHVLVPMRRNNFELAAATRLGDPGKSWILGLSLDRTIIEQIGAPELVLNEDFGGATTGEASLSDDVMRQVGGRGATRLALHVGTRRYRYQEYVGLDAVREREVVPLGFLGGLTIGRSLGIFVPDGVPDADDTYARWHSTLTVPVRQSIIRFSTTWEAGYSKGDWRDLLGEIDLALWARADWLRNQTIFFKASMGGGWRTTMPFQLSLGGREGVRSLRDDEHPGGTRLLLVLEDRIQFGWPSWRTLGLGATLFADAGQVWKGDVPYGADTDWVGSVGFGLRIALPAESRTIWRPEIVFPVGHDGSPIFRVTFEVNRIRFSGGTSRMGDARRFRRGIEAY